MVCDDLGNLLNGDRNEKTGVFCIFSSFPANALGEFKSQPLFFPITQKTQHNYFPPWQTHVSPSIWLHLSDNDNWPHFQIQRHRPTLPMLLFPRTRKTTAELGMGLGRVLSTAEGGKPPTCGVKNRNSTHTHTQRPGAGRMEYGCNGSKGERLQNLLNDEELLQAQTTSHPFL